VEVGTVENPGGGFIHAPGAAASGAGELYIMRSQYLESSRLQQSYIDVALASSCNKIPVESFVKETVSAGSFASMGKAIVEYVDGRRATLLVMGSRGMGAWTSSLAGIKGLVTFRRFCCWHQYLMARCFDCAMLH
jgi:hypothetical protein